MSENSALLLAIHDQLRDAIATAKLTLKPTTLPAPKLSKACTEALKNYEDIKGVATPREIAAIAKVKAFCISNALTLEFADTVPESSSIRDRPRDCLHDLKAYPELEALCRLQSRIAEYIERAEKA